MLHNVWYSSVNESSLILDFSSVIVVKATAESLHMSEELGLLSSTHQSAYKTANISTLNIDKWFETR